jgi:anti-sigma factor RsiW
MTCRELYGFLDEFLDGLLDAATSRDFERHVEDCASCRRYLASYRTTVGIARRAEQADQPAAACAPEALVRAILAARSATGAGQAPR